TDVPDALPTEFLSGFLTHPASPRGLLVAIRAGFREAAARAETARARGEAAQRSREIGELTRIGVALGTERDLKTLLDLILTQARRITQSDAGSLYLVEINDQGQKRLRFRLAQTFSKPEAPFVEFTIGVDRTSLAGYCAGGPGGRRHGEQPPVRGHRAAVRGLRARGGARDRAARSHHVRPQRARGGHDRRPRRNGGPHGRRRVPQRALHARTGARDPLRRAAARLRQGRRTRAGAGESEEAVSARPRARAAPARLHPAHGGARVLAQARRVPRGERQKRLRRLRA